MIFLEKLNILVALFATLVVAIVSSIVGVISLQDLGIKLIISITVFYIIGSICKMYLIKKVFYEGETQEQLEEDNEDLEAEENLESEVKYE